MATEEKPAASHTSASRIPAGLSLLVFGFGIAAGFLIAFTGFGFLQDSAAIVVTVFLSALLVVAMVGGLLILLRRPLWRKLFGFAETQIEHFAAPMARVAEGAVQRDPGAAVAAARELVQLALARYSWVTARRWIVASLTALIAAMAALAGTALLFKQNQLLEVQAGLLAQQNEKIDQQNLLSAQNVQLAEAQRNSALAVEITQIAIAVGQEASEARRKDEAAGYVAADPLDAMVNVLDPVTLDQGLVLRIVAASRAVQPYRFLDIGVSADNDTDKMRVAMQRRTDLPNTLARMATAFDWPPQGPENRLIDRPASPERGQLLQVLMSGGLRNLEVLNHFGLDLAFAYLQGADILGLTAQGGRLSYADFSGSHFSGGDFGGAWLENARFRGCRFDGTSFALVTAKRVRTPLRVKDAPFFSFLTGADFSKSVLIDVDFSGTMLAAVNFDGALLVRPDFTDATLSAATLRGAVLLAPRLAGAALKSTDLDGAVVFGASFLAETDAGAEPESFHPERYEAKALTMVEVMAINILYQTLEADEVASITGNAPAFRLKRIAAFAD